MQKEEYSMYYSFVCCICGKPSESLLNVFMYELAKEGFKATVIHKNVDWEAPIQYENEMGKGLKTFVLEIEQKLNINDFVYLKKVCMFIENANAVDNHRIFNLNPGFLSRKGMFLATHKPSRERGRVLIKDNIWIEQQYIWKKNRYVCNENTFSEYQNTSRLDLFTNLFNACFCQKQTSII